MTINEQELTITKEQNYIRGYRNGKSDALDKIRAEIQKLRNCSCSNSDGIIDDIEDILDKCKTNPEIEKENF